MKECDHKQKQITESIFSYPSECFFGAETVVKYVVLKGNLTTPCMRPSVTSVMFIVVLGVDWLMATLYFQYLFPVTTHR